MMSDFESQQYFFAHGKLLLTGEYYVLDGCNALAVPLKAGQHLTVTPSAISGVQWRALDFEGKVWLSATLLFENNAFRALEKSNEALKLAQLLSLALQNLENHPFAANKGWAVETRLDFPRNYGWGSSSTLVSLIAQWLGCDAYALNKAGFSGSGYDIACATAFGAIRYKRNELLPPTIEPLSWIPPHIEGWHLVWLNAKQNSREGIAKYRLAGTPEAALIAQFSAFGTALQDAQDLASCETILEQHEALLGTSLGLPLVKKERFSDFKGQIKSLGAWGGDFVLAVSEDEPQQTRDYFAAKGYLTCLPAGEYFLL